MSRLFYHTMQDNAGNLLFDVSGTMRLGGTGTLATIYGDEALTAILPNPMTNHPSYGSFKCYLAPGSYDFYMAKSGYTFETLTGLQGLGTLAQQNANAVVLPNTFEVQGIVGIQVAPLANTALRVVQYRAASQNAINVRAAGNDSGGYAVLCTNVAGTDVGSIYCTGSTTAFNTTSDARLKRDVDDLTGELAVIQALRPVSFRWRADDSPGVGFLAQDVAEVVDGVITGEHDAVDEHGQIVPQMIDYSKLVPFLVGACKTLAAQNEAVLARLALLEDAVGV